MMNTPMIFNLFFSLIHLFFTLFLIALGIFLLVMPQAPHFRDAASDFFRDHPSAIPVLGGVMFLLGILLFVAFCTMHRRHTYVIRSGSHPIEVDEAVVQKILARYWKKRFPTADVPSEIFFQRKEWHISADLPHLPFEKQRVFLSQVEQELQALLSKTLGSSQAFVLSINFLPLK